jgi:hypothetical protein
VLLKSGKEGPGGKCVSCAIAHGKCAGGQAKLVQDTIVVTPRHRPSSSVPLPTSSRSLVPTKVVPPPTSPAKTVPPAASPAPSPFPTGTVFVPNRSLLNDTPGSGRDNLGPVYDNSGTPTGVLYVPPVVDPKTVSRKRSAPDAPLAAASSSSKVVRKASSFAPGPSSSFGVERTISGASSTSSGMLLDVPAPFSSQRRPSPPIVLSAGDPSEDQMLLLLDALELAVHRGNQEDALKRIQALRRLRFKEQGYA